MELRSCPPQAPLGSVGTTPPRGQESSARSLQPRGCKSQKALREAHGEGAVLAPLDHTAIWACSDFCKTSTFSPSKQTHLGVFNQTLTFRFIQ